MASVHVRLGSRPCPLCGAQLVIRRNDAGTVTFSCSGADGCDVSGFAKKGTRAAEILAPESAPSPSPKPDQVPTKPGKVKPFDMGLGK